jgi:hypothetical protein
VLAGEFGGEDLPLYDIEIRYKGGLKNALLHPNLPGPAHKLEEGQVGDTAVLAACGSSDALLGGVAMQGMLSLKCCMALSNAVLACTPTCQDLHTSWRRERWGTMLLSCVILCWWCGPAAVCYN